MKQGAVRVASKFESAEDPKKASGKPYVEITSRAKVKFRLPVNDADPGAIKAYR